MGLLDHAAYGVIILTHQWCDLKCTYVTHPHKYYWNHYCTGKCMSQVEAATRGKYVASSLVQSCDIR